MISWLCGFLAAGGLILVVGCAAPAPVSQVAPLDLVPDSTDLLHEKMSAYEAGVAAGKRIQLRHDQAALTAATAALVSAAAAPDCPAAPLAPASVTPSDNAPGAGTPAAKAPGAGTSAAPLAPVPAPSYSAGGPAVPLSQPQ